ncbi:3-deoxy-7-phosphoheptulonate synthase [Rugosimonospora acidiphila]
MSPAESPDPASTNDLRITGFQPLIPPGELRAALPLDVESARLVRESRQAVRGVLSGEDDRLLLVVGPCSVHDPVAAHEYAQRLSEAIAPLRDDLCVVMRVYFEKPRTKLGWKGLINDPDMDGTHDVQRGLRMARTVLLDVLATGLPVACEFLEPTSPQYIADTVTWGAIGARTPESQVHRQLASGLSMPVGFKNATDGDVQPAIDGCYTAAGSHVFFGIDDEGRGSIVSTAGNPDCHIVLRGGRGGPNYRSEDVRDALGLLDKAEMPRRLVIDASHDNSGKDHIRQAAVVREIAEQVARGESGIAGLMMESFLAEGRQQPGPRETLTYGQSVTDACIGWPETERLLGELAAAVRSRREAVRTAA